MLRQRRAIRPSNRSQTAPISISRTAPAKNRLSVPRKSPWTMMLRSAAMPHSALPKVRKSAGESRSATGSTGSSGSVLRTDKVRLTGPGLLSDGHRGADSLREVDVEA
ncbi:hypothetical protein GCM10027589_07100 [Actinocorallia lasiicapitis]